MTINVVSGIDFIHFPDPAESMAEESPKHTTSLLTTEAACLSWISPCPDVVFGIILASWMTLSLVRSG